MKLAERMGQTPIVIEDESEMQKKQQTHVLQPAGSAQIGKPAEPGSDNGSKKDKKKAGEKKGSKGCIII